MLIMSREELLELFVVDESGIITSSKYGGVSNAFVGQPLYAAWYWFNHEFISGGEDDVDENGDISLVFEIAHEDADDFPELAGRAGEIITIKREVRFDISEAKGGLQLAPSKTTS
jgi:hypothetical protein